jgi:hypothetical protein
MSIQPVIRPMDPGSPIAPRATRNTSSGTALPSSFRKKHSWNPCRASGVSRGSYAGS